MHPDQSLDVNAWREADAALDQLLGVADAERDALLATLPLSTAARACAARLLAAYRGAGPLDHLERRASTTHADALSGHQVGRWRLLAEIGRGGMSVVYRAHAVDAPERLAAVKLLTLGARAGHGVALFRQEQAMLARLRHPHIATLYEAGVADDGTPWLAMALVEGQRIDAWCAAHARDARAVVQCCLAVCDAVAHAHRNLIIHRDIKPSNVMVDRDGLVRLLDFGIARLADQHEGDTLTQTCVLTPEYAAPEQFAGAAPSTAMDVYGLGALLHRLLTGTAPRAQADVGEAGSLSAGAPMYTALVTQARGDLEAIVLKALRSDPAQRYDTAAALAEDLRHWLDAMPVSARKPTWGYRLARFVRRHRAAVAVTAFALAALIAGLAISLWQARLALHAAAEARTQAANAQRAQQRAAQQLQRAEAWRGYLTGLFVATDPSRPSSLLTSIDQLLEVGTRMAQDAPQLDHLARADLLTTLGSIYYARQDVPHARAALDVAVATARAAGPGNAIELARALIARGLLPEGDKLDEGYFVEATSLLEAQAPDSIVRVDAVRDWAWVMLSNNRVDAAVALLEPVVNGTWNGPTPTPAQRVRLIERLAGNYAMIGRLDDAKRMFDEQLAGYRARGETDTRQFAVALINSIGTDRKLGAYASAEAKVREALAIYAALGAQPSQYRASANLVQGLLSQTQGQATLARAAYDAGNMEWARLQGLALDDYPYTHLSRGRLAAALLQHDDTVRELEQFLALAKQHNKNIARDQAEIAALLAQAHCALGAIDTGTRVLSEGRTALATLSAFETAPVERALTYAQMRCTYAASGAAAAIHLDSVLSALDAELPLGDADEFARHALLRIEVMRAMARIDQAQRVRDEAIARLEAAGLGKHPLAALLRAP